MSHSNIRHSMLAATKLRIALSPQDRHSSAYQATLMAKLAVVVVSGVTAFLHARARRTVWIAIFGALTALSALAAVFLGVLLAG